MGKEEKHYYSHMRFIQLSANFLHDVRRGEYTHQDLLVYATIKMLASGTASTNSDETAVFSTDVILSMINMSIRLRAKREIVASIKKLQEGGLIGIYKDFSFSEKIEDLEGVVVFYTKVEEKIPRGERFVKVFTEEYANIINSGEAYVSKLFHTYMTIVGEVFENNDRFTYITNLDIVDTTGFDKKTVTAHIKSLENCQGIYRKIVNFKDASGMTKRKNVMTRFGWRDNVRMVHI